MSPLHYDVAYWNWKFEIDSVGNEKQKKFQKIHAVVLLVIMRLSVRRTGNYRERNNTTTSANIRIIVMRHAGAYTQIDTEENTKKSPSRNKKKKTIKKIIDGWIECKIDTRYNKIRVHCCVGFGKTYRRGPSGRWRETREMARYRTAVGGAGEGGGWKRKNEGKEKGKWWREGTSARDKFNWSNFIGPLAAWNARVGTSRRRSRM